MSEFSLYRGSEKVRAVMLPFQRWAKEVYKVMVMLNEGSKIVSDLIAMDVTVWKIAKECGVSYQTGRAWKKGWWNPDESNTHKLYALFIRVKRDRGIF